MGQKNLYIKIFTKPLAFRCSYAKRHQASTLFFRKKNLKLGFCKKSILLFLLATLFLSGCDGDLITDEHRRQAINEAGAAYGLEFGEARGDIPDMSDGALVFIDADERMKVVTEVFIQDSSPLKRYADENAFVGFSYFISEEHRTAVFFGWLFPFKESPFLEELYDDVKAPNQKKIILFAKMLDSWTDEYAGFFEAEYRKYIGHPPDYPYALGEFLFNETHNPESPYYHINNETPETDIDEIIYNSLRETQSLKNDIYYNDILIIPSIIPSGNRVQKSVLSEDVWTVYFLPYRMSWDNTEKGIRRKIDFIRDDFLFLLEHHFNASDGS